MPFTCTICGEESTRICARCTNDTCNNHLCEKCLRCSDCCECEVALAEPGAQPPYDSARSMLTAAAAEAAAEAKAEPGPQTEPVAAPPAPEPGPPADDEPGPVAP